MSMDPRIEASGAVRRELRDEAKHLALAKEQEYIELSLIGAEVRWMALGEQQAWMSLATALGWNTLKEGPSVFYA